MPITNINPLTTSRETDHWSIYGLVEWSVTDDIKLTLEGRFADETIDVVGVSCGFMGPVASLCAFAAPSLALEIPPGSGVFAQPLTVPATGSISDSYFAPKATLEWKASADALLYFSVAQGLKPAGISTLASGGFLDSNGDGMLTEAVFDAEKLLTFEWGAKTGWLDNSLIINGAVFFQRYTDRQVPVQQIVGGFLVPFIENAARAEVFGIELDGFWQITENLEFTFAYAFLDTESTEFLLTTNSTNNIARAGNCTVTLDGLCQTDLSGRSLEGTPKHSFALGLGYRQPINDSGLEIFVEGDLLHQGSRFIDEFNDRRVNSYTTMDARIGLQADSWNITFFVNNITDDDTFQNWSSGGGGLVELAEGLGFFPSSGFGYIPNPRHVGVRFGVDF